jgi:multidrug efflux pump subunit AcrA (membrane-fusion protein)
MEELRSEEVQEILGAPPSWMVQWGTALVFIVLAALIALGWWVKYPERAVAPLTITTLQPPVPVIAPREGYIERLLVADNDSVSENTILAVMSNPADLADVLHLEEVLGSLQGFDQKALLSYKPDPALRLGELQADYLSFVQFFQEFSFDKQSARYDRRAANRLSEQLTQIEKSVSLLEMEKKKTEQAKEQAISHLNALLAARFGQTEAEAMQLQDARDQVRKYDKEVNDITLSISEKIREKSEINARKMAIRQGGSSAAFGRFSTLQQSLIALLAKIDQWKQDNLMLAPASGRITYYQIRSGRPYVQKGDNVMAILPYQTGDANLIGRMQLPAAQAGKVEKGQRVLIKVEGFPFQEFGIVEGVVEATALLPENGAYFVQISLPNDLRTSFGKNLPFRQQMLAKGEIIIQDKRLLERLLENLWFVYK